MDQHWVNALTRYYLEWIVELRKVYPGVEFFGQDDKAKVAVGDKVHVASGVRPGKVKGIVPADEPNPLLAMDHDFHNANIIPSVTLRCNIPDCISGSFFVGDEETGEGQIFVTLRDATFDGSKVMDHCAQLVDIMRSHNWKPTVLVVQADGGTDHSLKRVATKLAMIAMFKELDLDHLVVISCAPNGSARNKVERSMSVLNVPMAHVSLKRGEMPPWAERMIVNASSMKDVRDVAKKVDAAREKASLQVQSLEKELRKEEVKSLIEEILDQVTGGE